MQRLFTLLFLFSALLVAGAQEAAPPPDPASGLPVFGGALVRFVHASPNAGATRVEMTRIADEADEGHVVELGYADTTEYREFTEGRYDVAVHPAAADGDTVVVSERLDAVPGGVYTIAIVGLALEQPGDAADADEGFLAWLQGLFTPDRPELALRALILDDFSGATYGPDAPAYRIVHAAPGTDTVELAHVRDDASEVLATVSYLDASGFISVPPGDGRFEVQAAGTTATIETVSGLAHEAGLIHTVFLIGTPIEEVPLQTVTATAEWAEIGPVASGTVGTRGMTGLMTAAEVATLRELLVTLGQRVDAAEQRLADLADAGEGPVAEARSELDEAMALLEQAHVVLDAAERTVP